MILVIAYIVDLNMANMETSCHIIPIRLQPVCSERPDSVTAQASNDSTWRIAQAILLLAGIVLFGLLLFRPELGLIVMWNMLIPAAPGLLVVAPGIWRNVCPLSTMSLLPRRLALSRKIILPRRWAGRLALFSVALLYLIVPLRHIALDTNAPMTALMLLTAAVAAMGMGLLFDWRSGWCTSLCPIHPVERLYGFAPPITVRNMRCDSCSACTGPCPDSTRSMTPVITTASPLDKLVGHGFTGSFTGFVYGWYQLPDLKGPLDAAQVATAYLWPLGGAALSLAVYLSCRKWLCLTRSSRDTLVRVFGASAVSTYYWNRIPALVGFGPFPGTGLLYDLSGVLPAWVPMFFQLSAVAFFFWFMVSRSSANTSWMKRPAFDPILKNRHPATRAQA